MSYRLSSSEREFAEEHHNLVYAFLKKKKLDVNDYYDVVIFAYLTAVRRYFINKNLMQYNFSTIAWRAMESAVYKEKRKKSPILISLDEPLFKDSEVTLIDSLGQEDNFDEKIVYLDLARKIRPYLTKKQSRTLQNRANGYGYKEMSQKEGISLSGIGSRLRRARMKLKLVLIEGGKRI